MADKNRVRKLLRPTEQKRRYVIRNFYMAKKHLQRLTYGYNVSLQSVPIYPRKFDE